MKDMKVIVGLGNPGKKYDGTRHNLGFLAIEQFVKDYPLSGVSWKDASFFSGDMVDLSWQTKTGDVIKVALVKPKVYMNNSGIVVREVLSYLRVDPSCLWVVHDDIDLIVGSMRIKFAGSSAGHKGIQSIIDILGTDGFWRFRLGIGPEKIAAVKKKQVRSKRGHRDINNVVLGNFSSFELGKIKHVVKHCSQAIGLSLEEDLISAMNRFNTR